MIKRTIFLALSAAVFLSGLARAAEPTSVPTPKPGFNWEGFKRIAIQSRGRLKPLDTYARETVQYVTNQSRWNGFPPEELIFAWLSGFDAKWENAQFIYVGYGPLKKEIGLDMSRKYFSPTELRDIDPLRKLVQSGAQKEQRKEKLNELEKKALQLNNQLGLVDAVVRGADLAILPNPGGVNESWYPLSALIDPSHGALPYPPDARAQLGSLLKPLLEAYIAGNAEGWNKAVEPFADYLRKDLGRGGYPSERELNIEVQYNSLRPFRWAWVLYTAAFVLLLAQLVTKNKWLLRGGFLCLAGAMGLHIYGFGLRCYIAGRPPVTNMYESIIWVTLGCMVFSLLIFAAYRKTVIVTAASVFAIVGLVLADVLPSVLDPNIHPLEPVLRSNFWLTIHVLTITLSYAAFALSLCLGNVVLGNYLFKPQNTAWIQQLTLYMYRAVQIGVVLLAAGTILGGVWADYSWGRFWGWDPKEVWALIALLLYLAVLHGRFTGWLRGFGFAATTVLCYLGVLMAWYGVNFVLGVGLHSYGFGSGGVSYVLGYTIAQLLFIGAAYLKYTKVIGKGGSRAALFPKR